MDTPLSLSSHADSVFIYEIMLCKCNCIFNLDAIIQEHSIHIID